MDILNQTFDRLFKVIMLTEHLPRRKPSKPLEVDKTLFRTNYPFVFVSGFWSWGEYRKCYKSLPYWGFFTGNMLETFNQSGFKAVAADVSPMGSAWDRACELYAQINGTVVDYGRAHSEKYGHTRYGEDYRGRGLLEYFDNEHKINIVAHSFGCPTAALFAYLLENGSEEEKQATTDGSLSPLFSGNNKGFINCITGIAGAYNGTTLITASPAIESTLDYLRNKSKIRKFAPAIKFLEAVAQPFQKVTTADTPDADTGLFDMVPDNSIKLNKTYSAVDSAYYFTVPCQTTRYSPERDSQSPDLKITDSFFALTAAIIGRTDYESENGIAYGRNWQANDGLVNTISEKGPMNEEQTELGCEPSPVISKFNLKKGHYYVFNTYPGSHNDLCGGTIRPNFKATDYMLRLLCAVNSLD